MSTAHEMRTDAINILKNERMNTTKPWVGFLARGGTASNSDLDDFLRGPWQDH